MIKTARSSQFSPATSLCWGTVLARAGRAAVALFRPVLLVRFVVGALQLAQCLKRFVLGLIYRLLYIRFVFCFCVCRSNSVYVHSIMFYVWSYLRSAWHGVYLVYTGMYIYIHIPGIFFHFYFPAQLVGGFLPSGIFWTSRGHRCRPFSPPVRASNFYRAQGSAFPLLVDFH